ncbi:MAG: glycosyltransferase family 1 protein [Candidatus Magasanikbacteria bacterium]|nr:glycosyltransferase family 1 protein [Candidatus Magasanikbacteria bacterium]
MNIGIDLRTIVEAYRTGVGEFTVELLTAIFGRDQTNQYYLFANSWDIKTKTLPPWEQANVHFVLTRWPNKLLNLSLLLLRRPHLDKFILRQAKPRPAKLDILYSPNFNFFACSKNVKHVLMIHDLTFLLFPEFFTSRQNLWHRLLAPRQQCQAAARLLTPSESTKQDLINYYQINPESITVLTPGQNPAFENFQGVSAEARSRAVTAVRQKYNLPERFALCVGTIEPRKNLLGLIAGFSAAYPKLPANFKLVIAGAPGWKNKEIYRAAALANSHAAIQFLGYVEAGDKPALFAASEVFIFPSFYEGFGFPVLEAMSLGVPVITSARSSLTEVVGSAALLIDPHHPEQIAANLIALISDPKLYELKKHSALERSKIFSWHLAAEKWLDLLPSLNK